MNDKVKIALVATAIVSNIVFLVYMRERREKLPITRTPAALKSWQRLQERPPEEREKVVATTFALKDFDVKPLSNEKESIAIPRPSKWHAQMLISQSYFNDPPANETAQEDEADKKVRQSADKQSPWRAGAVNVKVMSISISAFSTLETRKANVVVVKEKVISHDGHMTKNGVAVPLEEYLSVGRYYVNEKEDALTGMQKATQINGHPQLVLESDVPDWLHPKRKLAIGESWVQVGSRPNGVPDTAPRPEASRKLNQLVIFEGRRAAEISSTSTAYDYVSGPDGTYKKRHEESLAYLDLETGEPLWFERKSSDQLGCESLVRGCNQTFTGHLIRISQR